MTAKKPDYLKADELLGVGISRAIAISLGALVDDDERLRRRLVVRLRRASKVVAESVGLEPSLAVTQWVLRDALALLDRENAGRAPRKNPVSKLN